MNVVSIRTPKLEYRGCGRWHDPDCPEQSARTLVLYFNRAPTDEEMRFLDECSARSVTLAELC